MKVRRVFSRMSSQPLRGHPVLISGTCPPADLVSPAISLDITKITYEHSMSLPLPVRNYDLSTFSTATAKSVGFTNVPVQIKRQKKPWARLRFKFKLLKGLAKKMK